MAIMDKGDLKTGFWVGLGLVGAFIVWAVAMALVNRARSRLDG